MQKINSFNQKASSIFKKLTTSKLGIFSLYLALSWLFALCSQVVIWLPFSLVPVSLQPAPVLLASFLFGWHAVNAYVLYLVQGALGLPFFAGLQGGILRLMGPTGGYLIGFLLAMMFIAATKKQLFNSTLADIAKYLVAETIIFACGLAQLSLFVPTEKLFAVGLYPFLLGHMLIKLPLVIVTLRKAK